MPTVSLSKRCYLSCCIWNELQYTGDVYEKMRVLCSCSVPDVPGYGSRVHTHDHGGFEAPDGSPDSILSYKYDPAEPHKIFEGHTLNVQKAIDGPKPVKGGFGASGGHQHHHQGGYGSGGHHHSKKAKYSGMGSSGGQGHLMAPFGPGMGFNPGVPPPGALTPVLGQALTALLASQGAVGIGNLLGGLGAANPQGSGYGNQGGAGYQQWWDSNMGQSCKSSKSYQRGATS
ncbi:hypothetical protein Tco_0891380 [Tanacetum coccineum]|uniref:Uncharacterized protein n=1 Tax=Tanacetum coccineum TaxID=301880 RepID=A0ABQ5C4B3_9ASTR